MILHELEQRVVRQEQQALDLTLVSSDRLREDDIRLAWSEARKLEAELQCHGGKALEFMSRLDCVMVDLLCADRRLRSLPRVVAA